MNILETEAKARAAVELFYNNVKATNGNFGAFINELNLLNDYLQQHANSKNDRIYKTATAFKMYFVKEAPKQRSIENIEAKGQAKRLSFKKKYRDYQEEYIILRNRGYSYAGIASYARQHFKVKVSKDSVRNLIKEFE